jgi:hypothetical protein
MENTGAVTAVRRFKLLYPRPPHVGFVIEHPEDTYVDWNGTGKEKWVEIGL